MGLVAARGTATITKVEAIPYSVPYRVPGRFASGAVERADNVLVRVHAGEGLVGQAEAQPRPYTYGETQATIVAAIRHRLGPALEGIDPLATELIDARCGGTPGDRVARGAIDLAVWDLVGQLLSTPCAALLGGFAPAVPVAHMVSFDEPHAMAEEAVAMHERHGIRTFKVKVGREVETDVAATKAIREALPDAELYVDANRGWTLEQAQRAGEELAELGVAAIEEPIAIEDRRGRARLAARWTVPLVGDESCISLAHVARELDDGAVGMVSVKVARTGFTESRRILGLTLGRTTPVVVGSQYEGGIGALATVTFASAFSATARRPAEATNFLDLADDLLAEPPEIRDGHMAPRPRPGLGIDLDEDRLEHFRLDR
ncbi:mandelate racemase/muconate lactonizing enzyme family protein [Solirubrobacter soli]|uniref:mandelate racemase/muconate lactonizing enzyme family protein n=1 Tax=Solirubrobacter soli TaxID=363832 RepID=UPI00041C471C|nr:enolase C-terminal domain-like protein [Solirubrobacter soli]